jgi:hypothetical protein
VYNYPKLYCSRGNQVMLNSRHVSSLVDVSAQAEKDAKEAIDSMMAHYGYAKLEFPENKKFIISRILTEAVEGKRYFSGDSKPVSVDVSIQMVRQAMAIRSAEKLESDSVPEVINRNMNRLDGYSVFHRAVRRGEVALVRELIKHGADIHCKVESAAKETPLSLAVELGHTAVARELIERGAHVDEAFVTRAMASQDLSLTCLFLSYGGHCSTTDLKRFLNGCEASLGGDPLSNVDFLICQVLFLQRLHSHATNVDPIVRKLLASQGMSLPPLPIGDLSRDQCMGIASSLRAQLAIKNGSWLTMNPCELSGIENLERGMSLMAPRVSLDTRYYRDNNSVQIQALQHLKQAVQQGNREAQTCLYKQLTSLTGGQHQEKQQKQSVTVEYDSKYGSSSPLVRQCDDVIVELTKKADDLKSRGWDKVNNQMQRCLEYLNKRATETRTGFTSWFGYSKGDYDTRVKIMTEIVRLKDQAEHSFAKGNPSVLALDSYIGGVMPLVNQGWSKRFASLLQEMQLAVAGIDTRATPGTPRPPHARM